MKVLQSTPKIVLGCKLLASFLLIHQLYSLGTFIFGNAHPVSDVSKAVINSLFALATGILMVSARKYFPVGSKERISLQFIGVGIGVLCLEELSTISSKLAYIGIIVKVIAATFFAMAIIARTTTKSSFVGEGQDQRNESKSNTTRSVSAGWFWGAGLVLGFLVGVLPILNTGILANKMDPLAGWVHVVWGTGLFLSAMGLSILKCERVWRWGIVVGVSLPMAVAFRMGFDVLHEPHLQRFYLRAMFYLLYSIVIGVPTALAGSLCGFLVKKTVEGRKSE